MTNKNDLLNDTVQDAFKMIKGRVEAVYDEELMDGRGSGISMALQDLERALDAFVKYMDEDKLAEDAGIRFDDSFQEEMDDVVRQNCSGLDFNYR